MTDPVRASPAPPWRIGLTFALPLLLVALQGAAPVHRLARPEREAEAAPLPAPLPPVQAFAAEGLPGVAEAARELERPLRPLRVSEAWLRLSDDHGPVPADAQAFPERPEGPLRPLVLGGHGSFHHLAYFVLRDLVEPLGVPYTVVNFDNHDDLRGPAYDPPDPAWRDAMDCGSWGRSVLAHLPSARRFVHAGQASNKWPDLAAALPARAFEGARFAFLPARPLVTYAKGLSPSAAEALGAARADLVSALAGGSGFLIEPPTIERDAAALLEALPTSAVYVSVDLDVLAREDFDDLGWGNGTLRLSQLVERIEAIGRTHPIVGADVSGFPPSPHHPPAHYDAAKDLAVWRTVHDALARAMAAGGAP